MVRIAVIQLEATRDAAQALASCAALIDRAALERAAQIVLFPELLLDDDDELSATGRLPSMLLERAARHRIWCLGSALHRGLTSSLWAGPDGELSLRACSDLEQTGAGTFAAEAAILHTPHGKIGLCAGSESLHFKVTRSLSLAGADMVCISLAQRPERDPALHAPARAAENQLFLAVAWHASIGPEPYPLSLPTLPPEAELQTERLPISQIFGPGGHPLASGEPWVAELDLPGETSETEAREPKLTRRPDLYRGFPLRRSSRERPLAEVELEIAALAYSELGSVSDAIAWAKEHIEELAAKEVALVVLPELFCFDPNLTDLHVAAAADFLAVVQALARACKRTGTHVITTLVEQVEDEYFHVGVVIGQGGIVLRQAQLHVTEQHAWATPGTRLQTARMPWGTLGVLVGADARVPELLDGLGRSEVELVAAPLSSRSAHMAALTLAAAADEAGYAVIAATPPAHGPDAGLTSASFIVDPSRWPLQRASANQEVLRATLRFQAIRDARRVVRQSASESQLRARTPAPAPAQD
ncbi:MAG: hypothetical protein JWN04_2014 [Myxococcaceae bacterium]|nr:hypothetical protein [Myxococcaceae bacterium]